MPLPPWRLTPTGILPCTGGGSRKGLASLALPLDLAPMLPLGKGQGEGGPEPVQRLDFPHPSPLPEGEGAFTWCLCPRWGGMIYFLL